MKTLTELQDAKKRMVDYLKLKLDQEDWHGCADAAMDIREIEAKMSMLKRAEPLAHPFHMKEYIKKLSEL